MESFAANIVCRSSSNLSCRFLLLPWVKRSRGICCSSEGTNNPSFPVHYVPKTSTKMEKPQTKPKPIKGFDKTVIKNGSDPKPVRLQVSNKMFLQKSADSEIKKQSLYQGLLNELPNGSYQEACKEIDCDAETIKDELDENVNELEIHQKKFPLRHDLRACEDKNNAENASIKSRATSSSNKINDSSIPLQSVPKSSLKIQNSHTSRTPAKGSNVAGLEVANSKMVPENRFSETNNGMEYEETTDDEYMEEAEEIHPGVYSLSQDLQACENRGEAEKAAIRLLGTRAYTAVELRKKLHGKRFPTSTIDAVITDFQNRGLINDGLYAESFARSRWSSSSWGPRRVKQALLKKGVTEVDTQKALNLVYEDGEHDSSLGLSKASMDLLYTQASKQWLRGHDVSYETRKSRIVRWLQYRGFSWGVMSFILKKLESKHAS